VSSRPYLQIPPMTSQPSSICGKAPILQIDPKWVSVDSIPVLTTLTYGGFTAPRLVEMLKIQSQKDVKQLAEAKEIAYKEGFYSCVMLVGECRGSPVQEAEPKVRASMIEQGLAFAYAEPENLVI
jgi:leucyl-tRNA synthetase